MILGLSLFTASCGDDDHEEHHSTDYDYSAQIVTPTNADKNVDDTIDININFASTTGETIHHISVIIYNKETNEEVYNKPDDAHVHETTGTYIYNDSFELSNANGVMAHSDWIMEAKVWGHEASEGEIIETLEFHVHP